MKTTFRVLDDKTELADGQFLHRITLEGPPAQHGAGRTLGAQLSLLLDNADAAALVTRGWVDVTFHLPERGDTSAPTDLEDRDPAHGSNAAGPGVEE